MNRLMIVLSSQPKAESVEERMESREIIKDRRVQRTRNLLHQALKQLLQEKSFQTLTVHDIVERADLNRGTFYLHFPDKYALLNDYFREEFHHILPPQLLASDALSLENVCLLILTVMEYLAQTHDRCRPVDHPTAPLVEMTLQQEIYQILIAWFTHPQAQEILPAAQAVILATALSWAIFGIGTQWSQGPRAITPEDMAQQALTVLVNGLAPVLALREM